MKSRYSKRAVQIAWLLTLVYFASYLMRKNFEIMADTVLVETGWAKSALSVIVVGMAVCYGIGQLVSGEDIPGLQHPGIQQHGTGFGHLGDADAG